MEEIDEKITEQDLPMANTPLTLKPEEISGEVATKINGYGRNMVSRTDGTSAKLIYITFEYNGATRKKYMTKSETLLLKQVFGDTLKGWVGKGIKVMKDLAKNPKTNQFQPVVRVKPIVN